MNHHDLSKPSLNHPDEPPTNLHSYSCDSGKHDDSSAELDYAEMAHEEHSHDCTDDECQQCKHDELRAAAGILFWSIVGAGVLIVSFIWASL